MYSAEWVRQAILGEVSGQDASAANMLAMAFNNVPGIEAAIADAMNAWVGSGADPASPTYWLDCVMASREGIRSRAKSRVLPRSGFYELDPEVPGGLGEHTELAHRPGRYPLVERLHYEFGAGRQNDDLFTSHPVYLVTRTLADSLRKSHLTGFSLSSDVEVSADENVGGLEPDWRLPEVEWLQVSGTLGIDDFGLTDDARLVVSETALGLLQNHAIDHCDVRPIS